MEALDGAFTVEPDARVESSPASVVIERIG
jgi:hypothetical protein